MDDKKAAPQAPYLAGKDETQALDARGRQDLECLSLLREAGALRREAEYLDYMFAALKGGEPQLPPEAWGLFGQPDD